MPQSLYSMSFWRPRCQPNGRELSGFKGFVVRRGEELIGGSRLHKQARVSAYAIIAAFGGFVFGYDTAVIAGAVGYLTQYFALSPAGTGWAVASALVGCMIGAAGVGELGGRLGRKKTLVVAAF